MSGTKKVVVSPCGTCPIQLGPWEGSSCKTQQMYQTMCHFCSLLNENSAPAWPISEWGVNPGTPLCELDRHLTAVTILRLYKWHCIVHSYFERAQLVEQGIEREEVWYLKPWAVNPEVSCDSKPGADPVCWCYSAGLKSLYCDGLCLLIIYQSIIKTLSLIIPDQCGCDNGGHQQIQRLRLPRSRSLLRFLVHHGVWRERPKGGTQLWLPSRTVGWVFFSSLRNFCKALVVREGVDIISHAFLSTNSCWVFLWLLLILLLLQLLLLFLQKYG